MPARESRLFHHRPAGASGTAALTLSYRTFGRLDAAGGNAILLPSHYTGSSASFDGMIGPGRALDPERHFIVAVDLFGNGMASSPSHAKGQEERALFPRLGIADNVACQKTLLEELGVQSLALIYGWSMGALQAWHWAVAHPDFVRAILPVCGAARCWPMNRVFLEGVRATLLADLASPPRNGLSAFGRAYAGWAYSPAFFRDEGWRALGHDSLETLLRWWEEDHLGWDADDLLAMLQTWISADVGDLAAGDWRKALAGVRARVIAMPCDTDRYFTLEENAMEVAATPGAELRPLRSDLGHVAGGPGRHPVETAAVEAAIRELLGEGAAHVAT